MWIALKPLPGHADTQHALALTSGPWRLALSPLIPASGIVLMTGKAEDSSGEAATLNLDSTLPVFCLRGAGAPPNSVAVIDIRRRWQHQNIEPREGRPRLRELGRRPRQVDPASEVARAETARLKVR